jgi:nucleotide-binding universal stress UspA family protein
LNFSRLFAILKAGGAIPRKSADRANFSKRNNLLVIAACLAWWTILVPQGQAFCYPGGGSLSEEFARRWPMAVERTIRDLDIILAVDGSEHSKAAAQLLCDLPLSAGSSITALAVLVPRDASGHAKLESALEEVQLRLQGSGVRVSTGLLTGYPAEMLSQYADEHKPDLIVLGAKGLRETLGILLGGVVQQIVEYASWPAMVVRAPYQGLRRILLVVDASPHSQRAVEYLSSFPLPAATDIHLVHVLPPFPSPALVTRTWPMGMEAVPQPPSYETEAILAKQAEEEQHKGQALIDNIQNYLEERQLRVIPSLLRGDDATEIIDYVKTNQIDLVVAGARGLSRMRRLLLGSLTRKLLHYAGCSVLVVKGGEDGRD